MPCQPEARSLERSHREPRHLLALSRRGVVPAKQVKEPVDQEKRELGPDTVTVSGSLPGHGGPRDGDVPQVVARSGERENVGLMVLAGELAVQSPELLVVCDTNGNTGLAFRHARRDLGHPGGMPEDAPDECRGGVSPRRLDHFDIEYSHDP